MCKEKKVYVINCSYPDSDFNFRDEEMEGNLDGIMQEAERRGSVYSLEGFQREINNEWLELTNSFILIR